MPPEASRARLFLDSARRDDWRAWLDRGLFYGVTTNPTLLAAAGVPCTLEAIRALVDDALAHDVEEIHVQTWCGPENDAATMTRRGFELAACDPRVVVKVPLTLAGLATVRALRARDVRTTLTAVYAPHQALTAAIVGADYAAPYLGRITDAGRDGHAEIAEMLAILRAQGSDTRLLVASIRTADDLARLARASADTFTIGAAVARALFAEPLTLAAATAFEAAASASPPASAFAPFG